MSDVGTIEFRKQSLWEILGLALITLGLYPIFCLRRHSETARRLPGGEEISPVFFNLALATAILSIAWIIPTALYPQDAFILRVKSFLRFLSVVPYWMFCLALRNRMNDYFNTLEGRKPHL